MKEIKIELGTEAFRSAVNKVYRGVGNMVIFMTTLIIGMEGKDGDLVLSGTDRSANIKVTMKKVLPEDVEFYVNTNAELLKKLIDKTQSATVVLEIKDDRIVFSGSGDANLEVIFNDEDGGNSLAKISEIKVEGQPVNVKRSDLDKFNTYLSGTYPQNIQNPVYVGYRVGDNKAMTYNNFGANMVEIDWDADILLPANIVDLFPVFEDDIIEVTVSGDNKIKLKDSTVEITGALRPEKYLEEYDIKKFERLVFSDLFEGTTILNRSRLAQSIDRLKLFIEKNDDNMVNMEVDGKGIMFITYSQNCVESIDFVENEEDKIVTTSIGIDTLEKALKGIRGENIKVQFGDKGALRIEDEADKAYMLVPYATRR